MQHDIMICDVPEFQGPPKGGHISTHRETRGKSGRQTLDGTYPEQLHTLRIPPQRITRRDFCRRRVPQSTLEIPSQRESWSCPPDPPVPPQMMVPHVLDLGSALPSRWAGWNAILAMPRQSDVLHPSGIPRLARKTTIDKSMQVWSLAIAVFAFSCPGVSKPSARLGSGRREHIADTHLFGPAATLRNGFQESSAWP